jgi:hypothetical protein
VNAKKIDGTNRKKENTLDRRSFFRKAILNRFDLIDDIKILNKKTMGIANSAYNQKGCPQENCLNVV